jgi:hypothetical protein
MKTPATMILILISGALSHAQGRLDGEPSMVTAYIQFTIGKPPPQIVLSAEALASRIFAKAGVRMNWRMGRPKANREEQPILIDITSAAPKTFSRGRLAYALVFEGVHITIFWDRVRGAARPDGATSLLAHVLVHEITHILQRTQYHSLQGVMKARWTAEEIWQMAWKPLGFDRYGLELMHDGLVNRSDVTDGDRKKDLLVDDGLRTGPENK